MKRTNRLVDWLPWGPGAFEKARSEGKPILLSIGYSACHWCHVMERESFSDEQIAAVLNERFVCVKVDREERPDVDRIYTTASMAAGWGGGWPLNVWLTPDLKPFYGGTYFPPRTRGGRIGLMEAAQKIAELWRERKDEVGKDADSIARGLAELSAVAGSTAPLEASLLDGASRSFARSFDAGHGGFGTAPKFPMPVVQNFLFRQYARSGGKRDLEMALKTLRAMADGGIRDQVGGGFHRYSTDAEWKVPHFEKMLYDNAQLAVNYLDAYQIAKDQAFAGVARDTLDYLLRDMRLPEGGFASSQDSDSLEVGASSAAAPVEGAFYKWTAEELSSALSREEEALFSYHYGIRPEEKNVLSAAHTPAETAAKFSKTERGAVRILEGARLKLRERRDAQRPRPGRDDKVIASWNGLAITALARGAQVLGGREYLSAAEGAARFARNTLYDGRTRTLYRRWRGGERAVAGMAEDYAFLIQGLLDLYEASFDADWLDWASELGQVMVERFQDGQGGGFFDAPAAGADMILRTQESYDGVEPAASSVAALDLLRLAEFTRARGLREAAERALRRFSGGMRERPRAMAQMLCALDFALSKPKQVIVAGGLDDPGTREMLRLVYARFLPNKILLVVPDDAARARLAKYMPFVKGVRPVAGKATAYICLNYACEMPTNDLQTAGDILDGKDILSQQRP